MPLTRTQKEALYAKLVATKPGVELKGDTIPYTSLNGHMYSMLAKTDEVGLRLPPAGTAEFIEKYNSRNMEQYGIVQKEYVAVPEELLQDTAALKPWFEASYNYVAGKKPKPTTRAKKG